MLRTAIDATREGDYLALLVYAPEDEARLAPLRAACAHLSRTTGRAVCLELGPRYLHSTGQLHKGGPNTGVFVLVTARDREDIEIPGKRFTLAALHRAQAEGDLVTLARHDRRVLRLDLPSTSARDDRRRSRPTSSPPQARLPARNDSAGPTSRWSRRAALWVPWGWDPRRRYLPLANIVPTLSRPCCFS